MLYSVRRIVFLGSRARMDWLHIELDYPLRSVLQRHTMIVSDDFDLHRMRGYRPEALQYIPAEPTPRMWENVTARGHQRTDFEEAKRWLKSLPVGR